MTREVRSSKLKYDKSPNKEADIPVVRILLSHRHGIQTKKVPDFHLTLLFDYQLGRGTWTTTELIVA
jgi:hypothetical protein